MQAGDGRYNGIVGVAGTRNIVMYYKLGRYRARILLARVAWRWLEKPARKIINVKKSNDA